MAMRREDILQAAAQIFRHKGYHAASMRDIAEAVELQKPSLYHHVSSKQEILLSILDHALDLLIADLTPIVETDQPAPEKLRRAIHAYVQRLTGEADLAAVLLLEHRSLERDARQQHVLRRDRFEALWRRILDEGVEAGAFRPVDIAVTVFAMLGVQNWMITWYRTDGRLSSEELADCFHDLFLRGLQAESLESSK